MSGFRHVDLPMNLGELRPVMRLGLSIDLFFSVKSNSRSAGTPNPIANNKRCSD